MKGLKIADNLTLPIDFATERIAFLARTGAGKSGGMRVLFEQIIDAGLFGVFIDPKGDAYGVRAEGKGKGKPVLVMGGDHGDVPLEATAGKVIAEFLVKERVSTVLDISDLSTPQMWKFVADFGSMLYKLNRDVMHVFLDEADMVAGQQFFDPHCMHALQLIQNKGRGRGFGMTVATQRPQILNKTILNACGTLVAMQTLGDDALKVVRSWLGQSASKETVNDILSVLPTLQTREAFVYSPQTLGTEPVRIRFADFQTFDSMRTPKPGETRQQPKSLADIDLTAVQRDMAATIEKVKAEDPKLLKAEIAKLRKEIDQQAKKVLPATQPETVTVEVPVLDEAKLAELQDQVIGMTDRLGQLSKSFGNAVDSFILQEVGPITKVLADLRNAAPKLPVSSHKIPASYRETVRTSHKNPQTERNEPKHQQTEKLMQSLPVAHVEIAGKISRPQKKILDVLASFQPLGLDSLSKSNLAVFADVSPKSSSFANNLGTLRNTSGALGPDPLIEYVAAGRVALTIMGGNFADGSEFSASTNEDLLNAWCRKLTGPQGKILRELFSVYPESISRSELAGAVDASDTSSAYANNLGSLRGLGLIEYGPNKTVFATELLFPFV